MAQKLLATVSKDRKIIAFAQGVALTLSRAMKQIVQSAHSATLKKKFPTTPTTIGIDQEVLNGTGCLTVRPISTPKYTLDTYLNTNNCMLASKFVTIHVNRTQHNLCHRSACLLLYTIKQVLALSPCKGKLIELKS